MSYSRDLADMDCHGWLSWTSSMDDFDGFDGWLSWMTFMDDFHGWLSWMTGMDYPRLLMVADLSYFYILFSYRLTDLHWYLLHCYHDWKDMKRDGRMRVKKYTLNNQWNNDRIYFGLISWDMVERPQPCNYWVEIHFLVHVIQVLYDYNYYWN